MGIFNHSPTNGFYGVLGSISVHAAMFLTTLLMLRPSEVSFINASPEINQVAHKEQVSVFAR